MSTVGRITKNTGVLFLGQIITYLFGFFITIYTARYLGVEGFGILSLALAITGIFIVFTDLGLSTLIVREVARDKSLKNKYVGNFSVMKLFLTFFTFGLIVIIVNLIGYSKEISIVIYLITVSAILSSFSGLFISIFQAHEQMEYLAVYNMLSSLILLIGTFIAIYFQLSILIFAILYIISSLVTLIYTLIIYLWKFSLPNFEIDPQFWKLTVITALPLTVSALFSVISFKIDTILLSILKGSVVVGFYTAPYQLMVALLVIPSVFTSAIYPVLSNFYVSSKESLKKSYEKSFKYLIILSLPIAVGTTLLANKIILIIYGSAFISSIIALQILIWEIPLVFLSYFSGTLLVSINKQELLFKITGICMIINIILNLIFIPHFSYMAASVITVLTELLSLILCLRYLNQFICTINLKNLILKPTLASSLMCLVIILSIKQNLLIIILISTVVYFTTLIFLKTFKKDDIILFKQILGKV
jgi:O-antigen/teichoic acid export membrane protein